jgi:DNA polymerase-3 subunit gamma/tau
VYQVLARKWRPQSFDTLVGQPHIARTLRNAIEADRLHHAYIFSGLRGTGKTSVARILAKCLNCEHGPTTDPCNECTPCLEITESRSIDVLEVDAASRTKVDQTRELLETLSYAPVRDRFKVLIIDEAHMLSAASFNALLKTLEEPPPRVTFILATTVLQKILPTIRSRCQVLEFRRVGPAELAGHLRTVCGREGLSLSDDALERIARAGDGSVRDALSVLERVVAFAGMEIADEDVLQALGSVRAETLADMVRAMSGRDAAAMLSVLDDVTNEGRDLLHFWGEMIGVLRDLQITRAVPGDPGLLSRPADEAGEIARAAADLSDEDLHRIFRSLADLEVGLKTSSQSRFLFESMLIGIASMGAVRPIEEVLQALREPSSTPSSSGSGGSGPGRKPSPGRKRQASPPAEDDFRSRFLGAIRRGNGLLAGVLSRASSIRTEDGKILIAFTPGNETFKRQAESPEYLSALQDHARNTGGRQLEIRITMEGDAPETAAPETPAPGNRNNRQGLLETARSRPGVRRLLHEFGAHVMDVRPMEQTRALPPENHDRPEMEESS